MILINFRIYSGRHRSAAFLIRSHSIDANDIGVSGSAAIREALMCNKRLIMLESVQDEAALI